MAQTSTKQENAEEDDQIVIFKCKRPLDKNPQEEFIINPHRPKKKVKLTEEEVFTQEFMSKFSLKNAVQYFLTRIDPKKEEKINDYLCDKRQKMGLERRKQLRQEIMNKVRDKKSSDKVKVIDIVSEDFVDFNGEKIPVENIPESHDYYILQRRFAHQNSKNVPQIYLPESAGHLIQLTVEAPSQEQFDNMEDEDSNREDHPYHDYPDENSSNNSSDEGVFREDEDSSEQELDEQELYRRYLKRCKRYEEDGDSDLEYIPF